MATRKTDPLVGTTVGGRFHITGKIGVGGMSSVYQATDTVLEREVAVKLMHREYASDDEFLERFRQEARSVAQYSHPNIVTIIDAGEDEGHPFIVFEYVEGEDLKKRIKRDGALPIADAVAYAVEIGRALHTAHDNNLVHRDVKPQNVLLNREGHAKVTDFGIARSLDREGLTEPGRVLGTTDYVSPEQALGHEVTARSDIYSLGVVLYEMLTGEIPFQSDTQVGVAMKHVREEIPDVQKRRPEVSAALAAIVERATAKEQKNRYPSMGAMVDDLEDVLEFEVSRAGSSSSEVTAVLESVTDELGKQRRSFRRRHPILVSAALSGTVLILAVAGVVAFGLFDRESEQKENGRPLSSVSLSQNSVSDYDPPPGDNREHSHVVGNVVDGLPDTSWDTESYRSPDLGEKQGVGLVIDAGRPVSARVLEVKSPKAGYDARVLGANKLPKDIDAGWTVLAEKNAVSKKERFKLDTVNRKYRYYLLWITKLGGKAPYQAAISQIKLLA